jgi:hypothetical protein
VVLIDHKAYGLQFFVEAISAHAVLEDTLHDGRAFGTFKKFLLLVHRADEIPVGRMQRKDEIKKNYGKRKINFKNMSLLL